MAANVSTAMSNRTPGRAPLTVHIGHRSATLSSGHHGHLRDNHAAAHAVRDIENVHYRTDVTRAGRDPVTDPWRRDTTTECESGDSMLLAQKLQAQVWPAGGKDPVRGAGTVGSQTLGPGVEDHPVGHRPRDDHGQHRPARCPRPPRPSPGAPRPGRVRAGHAAGPASPCPTAGRRPGRHRTQPPPAPRLRPPRGLSRHLASYGRAPSTVKADGPAALDLAPRSWQP